MKIEVTEGCTCFGCYVDDTPHMEVSEDKLREIVHKLVDMCNKENLETLVWDIPQLVGEYKHHGHCEDCGDSIVSWTVNID